MADLCFLCAGDAMMSWPGDRASSRAYRMLSPINGQQCGETATRRRCSSEASSIRLEHSQRRQTVYIDRDPGQARPTSACWPERGCHARWLCVLSRVVSPTTFRTRIHLHWPTQGNGYVAIQLCVLQSQVDLRYCNITNRAVASPVHHEPLALKFPLETRLHTSMCG